MPPILKSGVILLRPGTSELECLLVYRESHNDYSFPKGHVEEGESLEQAAIRETTEETGLTPILKQQLANLTYTNSKASISIAMFLATVDESKGTQTTVGDQGETSLWVPLSRVAELLSYPNLKDYFLKVSQDFL
jgi:8-oxo-(d)GTP phosphatase